MVEAIDSRIAPRHAHLKDAFRRAGFGAYLFCNELSEEEMQILKMVALHLRYNESSASMTIRDCEAQMWGEYQIGDPQRSLENANRLLELAEEGSEKFMLALNCKLYLQIELGQFGEAQQTLGIYDRLVPVTQEST